MTSFNVAAAKGDCNIIDILLSYGAEATATTDERDTPLHSASWNGHLEVVTELVELGGLEATNSARRTPLHLAYMRGRESVAKFLINFGADINAVDNTAWSGLHHAADENHESTTHMLLQNGIDPNPTTTYGNTTLHFASCLGKFDTIQTLAKSVLSLNIRNDKGEIALHLDCSKKLDKSIEIIKMLLENGSNPSMKDESGKTASSVAKDTEMSEAAALLIEKMQKKRTKAP